MNRVSLNAQDRARIREAVARHCPEMSPIVDSLGVKPLSVGEREKIRGALAEEFSRSFVSGDPTDEDLRLESLIDRLGHL